MQASRTEFIATQLNNGLTQQQAELAYEAYLEMNKTPVNPGIGEPGVIGGGGFSTSLREMQEQAKQSKPKNRWNYYENQWETKMDSGWVRNKVKSKAKTTSKEAFIKRFLKADSYADLSRFYVWPISKVKGFRTRINTQMKEAGLPHELPKLPSFTDSQQNTYNDQKDEGFTSSTESLASLFNPKKKGDDKG